jgi:transposase
MALPVTVMVPMVPRTESAMALRLALDNNATERALRGLVVGRKNHYGSRSERGTKVAALFLQPDRECEARWRRARCLLRAAARHGIRGERIPLPHEIAAS